MKLHRDPGISRKSAWHLAHRIRACWEREQGLFAGPAEVDETCVGGKERNKHESKKARAGRGPVGKTPVAGVRDRATNAVAARPLPGTGRDLSARIPKISGFCHKHYISECRRRHVRLELL